MKTLLISAAIIAVSGAAHAQDAYITQLGDNLSGINYSEYNQGVVSTQVIAQQGTGFAAANLSRGRGNSAMTYQLDTDFDNASSAPTRDSSTGNMESLIIQSSRGFLGGQNQAVTVQLNDGGPGSQNFDYMAQTIQEGNGNVGINWAQQRGGAMAGQNYGSITTPQFSLTANTTSLPSPIAALSFPYNSTATIN